MNSESNKYIVLSNISKGTAFLLQVVASCGFRKLVSYKMKGLVIRNGTDVRINKLVQDEI